jgi:hypothetical protein
MCVVRYGQPTDVQEDLVADWFERFLFACEGVGHGQRRHGLKVDARVF